MDQTRNFGFEHKSGILMPVSSLAGPYGIGTFGRPCRRFIDFLAKAKQTCWQVLPLNPTAYGDSPYQSPASFAGNLYFIDVEALAEQGLLTKEELASCRHPLGRIDYGWLFNTRADVLRRAYARFRPNASYYYFLRTNADWLEDYALFMALKVKHGYRPWSEWPHEERTYSSAVLAKADHRQEMGFWRFVQYLFHIQWRDVRRYARKKKIKIIGDMPIYVAYDSVEVWSHPELFLLDGDLKPTVVAGCPPDGFSPDGQLWGNPIYHWERMKQNGFDWWVARIRRSLALYDILRIDHFRGFAGYYVIPFGDSTARGGHWVSGVGKELFARIKEALPNAKIIAEDLGFITPDVRELLDFTGFPGMKILQFAFYDENAEYLPRCYPHGNCVVYTGSHDADCTATWCEQLSGDTKARFERECPRQKGMSAVWSLIDLAMGSKANLAVIPLQDYLELPNERARMNTPSTAEGNWTWRACYRSTTKALAERIAALTKKNGRH